MPRARPGAPLARPWRTYVLAPGFTGGEAGAPPYSAPPVISAAAAAALAPPPALASAPNLLPMAIAPAAAARSHMPMLPCPPPPPLLADMVVSERDSLPAFLGSGFWLSLSGGGGGEREEGRHLSQGARSQGKVRL